MLVSPESLGPCYVNASVVVAPIRYGHGTKIKALEALAHSKPLVATTEAVRGHPILNGQQALVADSSAAFTSACLAFLRDPERARQLAENGRRLAERKRCPVPAVSVRLKRRVSDRLRAASTFQETMRTIQKI